MQLPARLLLAIGACAAARPTWRELGPAYTFERYVADFAKPWAPGSPEYAERAELFAAELAKVLAHNARNGTSYKMGVNALSDATDAERAAAKGIDRRALGRARGTAPPPPSLGARVRVPDAVDWREAGVVTDVKDQGSCGSCWAFAGTETLESHVALATGSLLTLSEQEYVSCAPNPDGCGGTGGCQGATAEVLFDYVLQAGGAREEDYPYEGKTGTCDETKLAAPAVNISGYVVLPRNEYAPLLHAVATLGPVAISVDAGWGSYESGVYPAAECGTTIDHGVVLVGYGTDAELGMDYWLVRNSWGADWGEDGYVRLERQAADAQPCGIDARNQDGVGCDGDPERVEVCGTCAILYDTSFPVGAALL